MSLFVLDTAGDKNLLQKNANVLKKDKKLTTRPLLDLKTNEKLKNALAACHSDEATIDDNEDDYFGLPPPSVDINNIISDTLAVQTLKTKCADKAEQELVYAKECLDAAVKNAKKKKRKTRKTIHLDHSDFNPLTNTYDADDQLAKVDVDKELSNTKLTASLEQQMGLPMRRIVQQRKINRLEREKSKGPGWYGLPKQELTEEVQNDLKILQMRSALDPKHFYKKNDLKVLPKYFQIGTVMHSPLDYYNERNTRRNKKKSLVDELLADAEFQKFNKRKYKEIMSRRDYYSRKKALKKLKKLKQ